MSIFVVTIGPNFAAAIFIRLGLRRYGWGMLFLMPEKK